MPRLASDRAQAPSTTERLREGSATRDVPVSVYSM
jgi:hypothetical protein